MSAEHCRTLVDLIRHGEPEGGSRYRGRQDDPLSPHGWRQMEASLGEQCPWQLVVASPLSRCRAFAESLSEWHGLPLEVDERLVEISFGAWEGLTADQVEQAYPGALRRFYADPAAHPPLGGEALEAFRQRVADARQALEQRHGGKHLLVVCHAGVIRSWLALCLDLPWHSVFRIKVAHAAVSRVQCDRYGEAEPFYQLLFHGGRLAAFGNE